MIISATSSGKRLISKGHQKAVKQAEADEKDKRRIKEKEEEKSGRKRRMTEKEDLSNN